MQFVLLNEGDQTVRIRRIGGVAARFQALRPAFVVGRIQLKQPRVPVSQQEVAVVFVAVLRVVVHTEAFAFLVVVVVGALARPRRVALDAKVVVGPLRQLTHPIATFQNALRQRDARGDAVLLHLAQRLTLPLRDVRLVGRHRLRPVAIAFGRRRHRPSGPIHRAFIPNPPRAFNVCAVFSRTMALFSERPNYFPSARIRITQVVLKSSMTPMKLLRSTVWKTDFVTCSRSCPSCRCWVGRRFGRPGFPSFCTFDTLGLSAEGMLKSITEPWRLRRRSAGHPSLWAQRVFRC